jgi:hypothetical protein
VIIMLLQVHLMTMTMMSTTNMKSILRMIITIVKTMIVIETIEIVDIIIQVASVDLIDLIEDLDIMILYL